jgi:serine/threonine protein kinase
MTTVTKTTTDPLTEGDILARGYEVVAHLRRGNVLDVYDVWSDERDCRCVAKTPRPDHLEDARTRATLLREGELLERLAHPHLVRAYETIEAPRPAVILETLCGATVGRMIERGDHVTATGIADLGLQLCSAARYLHRHDTLHLDVKPSNVVCERGRAKLLDLSVARPPGRAEPGIGTWQYMSPEQVEGGELGPAADVWGIGATLWEVANHRRYPDGDRVLPAALEAALVGCLVIEPERRPSVGGLADSLNSLVR